MDGAKGPLVFRGLFCYDTHMNDEQMLKIRALMPNFAGITTKNGKDAITFYQGVGEGEPHYDVPISELIDVLDYLRTFHPKLYKQAVAESRVNEELDKIL
jgi:hypothetical protein